MVSRDRRNTTRILDCVREHIVPALAYNHPR